MITRCPRCLGPKEYVDPSVGGMTSFPDPTSPCAALATKILRLFASPGHPFLSCPVSYRVYHHMQTQSRSSPNQGQRFLKHEQHQSFQFTCQRSSCPSPSLVQCRYKASSISTDKIRPYSSLCQCRASSGQLTFRSNAHFPPSSGSVYICTFQWKDTAAP